MAAIKTVPGRRWHPEEKYWTAPHTSEAIERMRALFTAYRVGVAATVRAASTELPAEKVNETVTALDRELTLRGYSTRTRENYCLQAQCFLKWLWRDPATADEEELRTYLLDILDGGLSASYARQARATLVILYENLLKQPKKVVDLPSARTDQQLPTVLSREEVQRLLKATVNVKEEVLLTVIYSAGLRVSEAMQLKTEDIL